MSDYIPGTEALLKGYGLSFASLVGLAPAAHGLMAGDATQIEAAAQDYATKYDLAMAAPTRTKTAIVEKNNAKAVLITILRGYAMQIKNNRAVTAGAKSDLGLTVNDADRTAVPAPVTFPVLQLLGATPRRHELRWNDSGLGELRAKPAGARGLEIYCHVGTTAPDDPMASRFKAFVTRQPFRMDFALADVGKTAWYYARWQTGAGLNGPWSQMVSMLIAG